MLSAISFILVVFSIILVVPSAVLLVEVVAALVLPDRRASNRVDQTGRPRIAVLVPAHNESERILITIQNVKSQLLAIDRLLVIADNCTDDTASIAANAGALVIERHDLSRIGKGYALDFGVRALLADPPEVVLVVDADCELASDAINMLAFACLDTGRPVQARYLMTAPEHAGLNLQVAEFAWRLKNWLRPLGLHKLNLPSQLVGSGMTFPWKVIENAPLDNGWLVEDLKLGIDLAITGFSPVFCPSAICTSEFATSARGAQSQRQRWEHGHVRMILHMPRAVFTGLRRGKWEVLTLAADLIVPPLTLWVLIVGASFTVIVLLTLVGVPPTAFFISLAGALALALAVFLTWFSHGRDILPMRDITAVGRYILGKLPLYARIFSGRASNEWVRTDRGSSSSPDREE